MNELKIDDAPTELVFGAGQPIKEVVNYDFKLKLLSDNDPLLHEALREYDFSEESDEERIAFVKTLVDAMKYLGGVGLSANQVGVFKRVFVMCRFDIEKNDFVKPFECFNPKILDTFDNRLVVGREGCLSYPGLTLQVKRNLSCQVQYQTARGTVVEEYLSGLDARCFQHELDHMNGITFTKKVSPGILNLAMEKQRKLLKKHKKIMKNNLR